MVSLRRWAKVATSILKGQQTLSKTQQLTIGDCKTPATRIAAQDTAKAKSGSTAYAGDGKLDPGETPADEPTAATPQNQNPINMSVSVAKEPQIVENLKLGDLQLQELGLSLR